MDESLQRKQKLAQMLIDANEVREQYILEHLPARKVAAAEKHCAQLIASLIEEGVAYEYHETDNEEGIITINIDGDPISCKNDDIYEFLGEMYEPIMKKTYEALTGKTPASKKNAVEEPVQPQQPYAPIIIQTSEKPAPAPAPPVQEYVPPKVYLNEEDEYMQLKKKHEHKKRGSKGLLKVLTIVIISGSIMVLYVYNPGFNKAVNNTWSKFTSIFDKKDASSEDVTIGDATTEAISIQGVLDYTD